jgi:predicted acylesterase/phospholipase RssA
MSKRGDRSGIAAEPYSPLRRTALVFTGVGTAGAYHAGVLRAFHETAVKVDVVAGRGIGAVSAMFAAVDGGSRLWEPNGFWRASGVGGLYPWHPVVRGLGAIMLVAAGLVMLPLAFMVLGLAVFPLDFVLTMVGVSRGGLTGGYLRLAEAAFSPDGLPTWLPRVVVLVLLAFCAAAAVTAYARTGGATARHGRGTRWWRLVPQPLSAAPAVTYCWSALWDLIGGAANLRQPVPQELARRYAEMLSDNIGQPGFRELALTVYDLDARQDVFSAVVADSRRQDLLPIEEDDPTGRGSIVDLCGVARDHLVDVVAASLCVPLVTEPRPIRFASDSFWRGETHRLVDRPGSLVRLLEGLIALHVEQVVVVSATAEMRGPHELARPRLDGRGRLGEWTDAAEVAAVRDALSGVRASGVRVFVVRPSHNPVGAFDVRGGFDDRSDRRHSLTELVALGYEDACRQFIEPVVAPSGDRVALQKPSKVPTP